MARPMTAPLPPHSEAADEHQQAAEAGEQDGGLERVLHDLGTLSTHT